MPGDPRGNYDYSSLWTLNEFVGQRAYDPGNVQPPALSTPLAPSAPTPPIAIGLDAAAYEGVLFGKDIPVFIGGRALMGGRIIEGPFYTPSDGGDQLYEYLAMHALAANPSGTRTITEFRLRGEKVWTQAGGYLNTAKLPSGGFDYRPGTKTQMPFAASIGRYGSAASAYRWGICSAVSGVSLRAYNGIIGLPSVLIEDSTFGDPADGITRKDAIETVLRYMRFDDSEFEVDVSGSDSAWIIGSKMSLLDFLQRLRRIFVHYNITYTDKIRIIEPTSFAVDHDLNINNTVRGSVRFSKTDPLIVPRQINYQFINKDRDYEPDVAVFREDVYPMALTSSVESEDIELPIVTTPAQAVADVNVAGYERIAVRSQMESECDVTLFGMEVGDAARYTHSPVSYVGRTIEAQHDFHEWRVKMKAGEVLNCGAEIDEVAAAAVVFGEDGTESAIILDDSGVSDSARFSASMFFDLPSDAAFRGSTLFEFSDETIETAIVISLSGGNLRVTIMLADTDGLQSIWIPVDPMAITEDAWHSLAVSVDVSPPDIDDKIVTVVLDRVEIPMSPTGITFGAMLQLSGVKVAVPSVFTTLPDSPVRMSRGQVWSGQYIDWTDADNLAKVVDGSNAPVAAATAAAAFGAPTYLFDGGADTFAPAGFALTGTLDDYSPGPP